MLLKFAFFAFLVAIFEIAFATNYCDPSLCNCKTHIACNHTGNFASSCTKAVLESLTQDKIDLIVNAHNTRRNLVAGGSAGLNPASRMATMQWDDELAYLAELNVKQCQMKHDACRNTVSYKYAGQNVAWLGYYGSSDPTSMIEKSMNMWYNEIKDTTIDHINNYPSGYSGPVIGHFTVMMADRNTRLGCAAITYDSPERAYNEFLLTCNYATTNMVNFPIYTASSTAASDCQTGVNPNFPNLCSTSEEYDVNKWY